VKRLFFSPQYEVDMGGHVFPTAKFGAAAKAVGLPWGKPEPPGRQALLLAHSPAWVDKVLEGRLTLEDETLLELPFSPALSLAHRLQVTGTILAAHDALQTGLGLHAGGGSHHAFADHGEGFCLLNDLAVAARSLNRRTAIIDLDVHQGNGTASILRGDPRMFTFSMHQADLYPEVKVPGSLDVELPAGTGDREYLDRLCESLERVFAFKPELVLYQAGVDGFEGDLLGGWKLTQTGLEERDRTVFSACKARGVPVAVTLGGGYSADLALTASLHAQTLLTGLSVFS
jgi:acetoin utilization deacetylase AcuC-like enzyme